MNRFKVYCGPTVVNSLAECVTPHVSNVFKGTEHVYFDAQYTVYEALALLNRLMSGFTLRDVEVRYEN